MASGISRSGRPVQAGDSVSITGTVVSVTGSGPSAVLVILCAGALNGPVDATTGAYSYTLTNTGVGTNVPSAGVYAADVNATQSL